MKGEHTVQLSIIRRDSAPSGQEELRTESFTVTVKDRAEEVVSTKPGMAPLTAPAITGASPHTFINYLLDWRRLMSKSCPSCHRRESADFEAASTARHGPAAAGGEAA